jgi:hypothetical protein
MGFRVRLSFLALLVGALVGISAPAGAQASGFGVEKFFAANCKVETCGEKAKAPDLKESEEQGYTQAAGHPPYGVTDFKLKTVEASPGLFVPAENLKNLRIDVAPGVSTDPEAVAKCSVKEFESTEVEPVKHIFLAPKCAEAGPESTVVGENKVTTVLEVAKAVFADVPLSGKVYNLEQPNGFSSYFGVALQVGAGTYVHTFIEGHVEWASDYHDYFEIKNINPGLVESRLIFKGNIGTGGFLANPSRCAGPGPLTTTGISGEAYEGESTASSYETLLGTEGCENSVPFAPTFSLTPATTKLDSPDGLTAEVGLPHNPNPEELDSAQLKTASVTLPEGMTLNPSAAAELGTCTPKQIGIGTRHEVECPANSKVGTVILNVPGLPPESLTGNIYLGGPEGGGAITASPYTIYVDAESARYGLSVRLEGSVQPDEAHGTGRLTVTFAKNPEQPFTSVIMHLKGGEYAPIANPLTCGTATAETSFSPFTIPSALKSPTSSFVVDGNGEKGACASPLPFAPTQETVNQYGSAGGHTVFKFALNRPEGQQYVSRVETILPAGLVGAIPVVPLCMTADAGVCPEESLLGPVVVTSGAGAKPFTLPGKAYLTGPYQGAPYGLFISVPVVAGPFNLGNAITRAKLDVAPKTGRVIVSAYLPTIVTGGVPTRVRSVSIEINRPGFLSNPTNCGVLATESTVTGLGSPGTSVNLSSPFQVNNCAALAFKPSFKAATSGTPTKAGGASLETTLSQAAGQANIKSVVVQLPKQLPSRLTTLQKACASATFEANPTGCSPESIVGTARAVTPVLPGKLTGQAYLVGHAGAAFPDLDLVLDGDGVRVILVGNTDIKNGITTTTFASTPDVPVTSITVNLPMGPHSALAAFGSLCAKPLVMPTTIVGQNGVTIKQNTIIKPVGCGVKIVGRKVIGNTAYITVQTPAAGRVSGSGASLGTVYRHLGKAYKAATLKVSLTPRGQSRRRPFKVRLRVGFLPKSRSRTPSTAFVTVTFR